MALSCVDTCCMREEYGQRVTRQRWCRYQTLKPGRKHDLDDKETMCSMKGLCSQDFRRQVLRKVQKDLVTLLGHAPRLYSPHQKLGLAVAPSLPSS